MGILADWKILKSWITPFVVTQVKEGVISYGLSSYGYDIRVGRKYKVFSNAYNAVVDPKNFNPKAYVEVEGPYCLIPPNSFALAESFEEFNIPRDVLAICLGKSTYARCGIIVNITPLEPEWRGKLTIEISNTTPLPAKIYSMEGIAQVLFLRGDGVCETSYADRKGRYQGQEGLTLPFVSDYPE